MTPFHYLDGPLEGRRIEGDFKPLVYNKYTFALIVHFTEDSETYRLWIDVAAIEQPTTIPTICNYYVNGEIYAEDTYVEPPSGWYRKLEPYFKEMELVSPGGLIKRIDV